jgi:2-iminobutanoate/2-iminopropanoate deaminase
MDKQIITTQNAPAAIGPYSQAIRVGPFLFTSGQIPLDPSTGSIVEGDITAQVRRVMQNLQAVLQAAGLSFTDVIKTTIFVKDMGQFSTINQVYGQCFPSAPPARSTVQVAKLPLDAGVEIEMIACGKE